MVNRAALASTGGFLLVGTAIYVFSLGPNEASGVLRPDDVQVVSAGAEIYENVCAACHGVKLEGQPDWRMPGADGLLPAPPHDATGHTWHHDDTALITLTKYGLAGFMENPPPSGMPAYDGLLSDGEIVAVLSYIKSTWPDDIQARHDELNTKSNTDQMDK
ncbi:MAG: cytochrome c [Pseudomonadota bacterium]